MPQSELRLIKRCAEFRPRDEIEVVPPNTRGIYALLRYRPRIKRNKSKRSRVYDVVYVGMAGGAVAGSIKRRLRSHSRSKRKGKLWTHFSIFEVWDNIQMDEIKELEGLLRHIYRRDTKANQLNRQRGFKKLKKVRVNDLTRWKPN